jgi:hypothetical protein
MQVPAAQIPGYLDLIAAAVVLEGDVEWLVNVSNPVPRCFKDSSCCGSVAPEDDGTARSFSIAETMHLPPSGHGSANLSASRAMLT